MKHRKTGRKLSRVKRQREALMKTLLGSLIMSEKIITTEAKAKEAKLLIDKIINKAKKSKADSKLKVSTVRGLKNKIPSGAVDKLRGDFLNKFNKRKSGYTRVVKLPPRKSDSAKIAVIEFV
ncbi:50S ribosomal protein L17 [bacterium BMS3Abin15]|nr:50S ribosomal protein L17 [bacterium BMS3Abin15]HDZ85841.1 50S ribosomal protein L17 [Candidatus Moranbacteria bacterium]